MVAAVWAVDAGVREKMGRTPVPSRMRSVTVGVSGEDRERVARGDVRHVRRFVAQLLRTRTRSSAARGRARCR